MMVVRGLALLLLLVSAGARRTIRSGNAREDAQEYDSTLSSRRELSYEAREAFIPQKFVTPGFRRMDPQASASRKWSMQDSRRAGFFQPRINMVEEPVPWFGSARHRAKVALQVASGAEDDELSPMQEPAADEEPADEEPVAEEGAAPAETAAQEPAAKADAKKQKTPLEELAVGQEVEGKIRSVMSYGAFVNVGAVTDGLLHVSEISNEFVQDANEKLTKGDTVNVWIKSINLEKGQLALTCKEPGSQGADRQRRQPRRRPDLSKYESADDKEWINGTVNSITDFGAFVTLEDGVDGLVHISQVQEGGVGKVSDVLTVGQEVQVRVVSCEAKKGRIGLSMLPWSEQTEKRQGGRSRGGFDAGFGSAEDKAFQMSAEALEALTVGEEAPPAFEAAFERAAFVQKMKAEKQKYGRQVL